MQTRTAKLTQGPVAKHLRDMTLPMLLGITTMMAQSFIDTWFLGRVGDRALAAYSFGFPILMIVTSVAIGLGAGTSSVVARAIGSDDDRRARRLVTDSVILSFVITAGISIVGILTIDPLFRLLGAPDDMIPMIKSFMTILYCGVPFIVVGMVGMSSMRATGDTRLPGKLMIAGAVLNVVLDPIFIFGFGPVPAMGLNGAATAGLIARGLVFIGTVYLLLRKLDMISFVRPEWPELKKSWVDILHVGLPAAGTNAIVPVGLAVITAMIARFGPEAVAGFGVASRIESLVLVLYYAMSSVIGPFVGQNLSAGKEDRIQLSLQLCARFCIASGLVISMVLALLSGFLPTLFSDNEDVTRVTRLFLWIAPISYGAYGIVMVVNAAFNGLGNPLPGVVISVTRILLLYVPLALLGMKLYGIVGIFAAYAVANILTGILGYYWARHRAHRLCRVVVQAVG
ncbi:MAG: MATE family efflux transporter [Gammaproteobacteria bacterium]|nr:MATE family efflux transporter [Gammaproteobacteria bacterium]